MRSLSRAAPSVSIEVRAAPAWQVAIALLGIAVLVVVADWAAAAQRLALGAGLAAVVLGGTVSLLRVPRGRLRWDGMRWWWNESEASLDVRIDLGNWMLLRLRSGRVSWLPVSAAQSGAGWNALRAAIYCSRPEPMADVHPARDV